MLLIWTRSDKTTYSEAWNVLCWRMPYLDASVVLFLAQVTVPTMISITGYYTDSQQAKKDRKAKESTKERRYQTMGATQNELPLILSCCIMLQPTQTSSVPVPS